MGLTYFKRFRMEIDLVRRLFDRPRLPLHYDLVPWRDDLLDAHAETKYQSFRTEIDANVFPCLGDPDGCRRLMGEISRKSGFLSEATWLAVRRWPGEPEVEYCGTIQGIRDRTDTGAIQNLGVVPEHRGRGLGQALLLVALDGFQRAGLERAYLEVTADNEGAIKLYRRLGFRRAKTVYKAAEVAYS